jgi:carbonic anhydrase
MNQNLTANEALSRLKLGNSNFMENNLDGMIENSKRFDEIVLGQSPYAIILSCADSRVIPEVIFDTGLGEIFVVRVAGNIANASSMASIEYAVAHLGVNLIVVMGHENCGAVAAAIAGGDNGPNLNHLVGHILPAVESCTEKEINMVVRENAKKSAKDMVSNSRIINDACQKDLRIVSAFYNLRSGKVEFLD